VNRFKEHKDAMVAIEKMNNFPLAGREVRLLILFSFLDSLLTRNDVYRSKSDSSLIVALLSTSTLLVLKNPICNKKNKVSWQ